MVPKGAEGPGTVRGDHQLGECNRWNRHSKRAVMLMERGAEAHPNGRLRSWSEFAPSRSWCCYTPIAPVG